VLAMRFGGAPGAPSWVWAKLQEYSLGDLGEPCELSHGVWGTIG